MINNKKDTISIAIASGKGGTGKTLFSVSLFHSIKNKFDDVILLDADAEEPNDMIFFNAKLVNTKEITQKVPVIDTEKCKYCSKCHDWCNYNAIFILPKAKIIKVTEELCHGCGACTIACEFGAITEKDVGSGKVNQYLDEEKAKIYEGRMHKGVMTPVKVIKASHKITKNHKIRIIDSPPGTSCPFIQTVATADYVILITEPTPFGLSDLKQSISTLEKMNKYFGVVINKAGIGDTAIYDYLSDEDIEILMEIPFDKSIAKQYSEGEIISKQNTDFENQLTNTFNYLLKNYGNCSN